MSLWDDLEGGRTQITPKINNKTPRRIARDPWLILIHLKVMSTYQVSINQT